MREKQSDQVKPDLERLRQLLIRFFNDEQKQMLHQFVQEHGTNNLDHLGSRVHLLHLSTSSMAGMHSLILERQNNPFTPMNAMHLEMVGKTLQVVYLSLLTKVFVDNDCKTDFAVEQILAEWESRPVKKRFFLTTPGTCTIKLIAFIGSAATSCPTRELFQSFLDVVLWFDHEASGFHLYNWCAGQAEFKEYDWMPEHKQAQEEFRQTTTARMSELQSQLNTAGDILRIDDKTVMVVDDSDSIEEHSSGRILH